MNGKIKRIKQRLLLELIAGVFICVFAPTVEAQWEYSGSGIKETAVESVVTDNTNSNVLYASTDFFVYISKDTGKTWKEIFTAPGKSNTINFIAVSYTVSASVLTATKDGLYASLENNGNFTWKKIYSGSGESENNINCVSLVKDKPEMIFLGNDNGIFQSLDAGASWKNISVGLGALSVKSIVNTSSGRLIYIAADKGIFKTLDSGASWQKVYSLVKPDFTNSESDEEASEENEEEFVKINYLVIDSVNANKIYAATSKGVLKSVDSGKTWVFMTRLGLDDSEVKHVLVVAGEPERLYAATYKGAFIFNSYKAEWVELYKGANFRGAKFLSADKNCSYLWAASSNGLFVRSLKASLVAQLEESSQMPKNVLEAFKKEPSIGQVQQAAMWYGEVHPQKIAAWRKQAAAKGFFPKFSAGVNRNATDLWHWDTGGSNSDVLVRGRDAVEWDMSLSWDLGEFIWNSDQTSIDTRSRLTTQLRDDILDDITRLYYERRRLQVEMAVSPPKSEKDRYEKLLRIEELTANIDALTGGYFSAKIAENKQEA